MTTEQLKQKQKNMSNEDLILECRRQVSELAKTGGRSHKMCVPPMITDTDMIFSELLDRFEEFMKEEEGRRIARLVATQTKSF